MLFKNFRKPAYDRIINFFEDHSVLSPTQYGFRSNFSRKHAVLDIVNTFYDNIDRKMYSGLVLLDLLKLLTLLIIIFYFRNLSIMELEGKFYKFYQSFLENRKHFECINKFCSTLRDVDIGVPQSSTRGPLLFLLYNNMTFLIVLIMYLAYLQMILVYLLIHLRLTI